MNLRLTLSIGLGALFVARLAAAQEVRIGYQGLPYKYEGEKPTGIQLSDGVLMHVGAGAEMGYDSNVFYQDSNTLGSGILRVQSYAEITNASRTAAAPTGLAFSARASLQYRYYTSNDPLINGNGTGRSYRHALMPAAGLSLNSSLSASTSVGFADAFVRTQDPPYNPGQAEIARDNNQASAEIRWAPGGGRINGVLRYTNMIDVFETPELKYANSLSQYLLVDVSWKWLPKTAMFVQVQQGYVTYLDSTAAQRNFKASSYPLHVVAGLRGLITEKTSAIASIGYANGFYGCANGICTTTSGIWGQSYLQLEATYRPTLLSRIVAGYRHDFQNSIISAFYYDEAVYASYVQQIAARFAFDLSARYDHKSFQGYVDPANGTAATRTDDFFLVGMTTDYFIRNWVYAGVGYSLTANISDYTLMTPNGPASVEYVKHQVFARLGATY